MTSKSVIHQRAALESGAAPRFVYGWVNNEAYKECEEYVLCLFKELDRAQDIEIPYKFHYYFEEICDNSMKPCFRLSGSTSYSIAPDYRSLSAHERGR